MRRAKSKKQKGSIIHMPKAQKKNSALRKSSSSKFTLFKRKNSNKSLKRVRNRKVNGKYLIIPVILILFGGLVFVSIKYVLTLRDNAFGSKSFVVNDVTGIPGVPEYPGAVFLFLDNKDDSVVKEFLAAGNSSYRLPSGIDEEDVEKYYQEVLPDKGWELVSTVKLGTEDKKYGQYWVKDGKGLRIYLKFKDVWYESITEGEARNALADRVKQEIEREMLMASSEKQDLLPDYPWKIQIPKEYLITYGASEFKDFRTVSFQKIGTSNKVTLYPVGYLGAKELDYMLEDYCSFISNEEDSWAIVNTVPITFKSKLALRGSIASKEQGLAVAVIPNSFNNVVYVLSSTQENDPLFGYILDNVKTLGED